MTTHGDRDLISPLSRAERIAELTGGRCVVIRGGGHIPLARDPVRVNLLIHELAQAWRAPHRMPLSEPAARPWAVRRRG